MSVFLLCPQFSTIPSCLNHIWGSSHVPSLLPAADISCLLLRARFMAGTDGSSSNLSLNLTSVLLCLNLKFKISQCSCLSSPWKEISVFTVDFERERFFYSPSGSGPLLSLLMISCPSSRERSFISSFFKLQCFF